MESVRIDRSSFEEMALMIFVETGNVKAIIVGKGGIVGV